ncbi:MAG: hypothetical protein V4850_01765 [Myxococcota bacterium]
MLIISLLGCLEGDKPLETPHAPFDLGALDAGAGDGRTVEEFVSDELTVDLSLDWSFLNLADFAADTVSLVAGEVPVDTSCVINDEGAAESCTFWMDVSVSSTSGLWGSERRDFITWAPNRVAFCFGGTVVLTEAQVDAIAARLEDDGIAFDGRLDNTVCRGMDGSGYGLPDSDSQANVFLVEAGDSITGVTTPVAADDTVD